MSTFKKVLIVIGFLALATTVFFIARGYQKDETFTVTFDSNGGTKVEKQEVKANEKVEEPEEPTKDGYVFKGWYLSGKKYDFDKKVTKDIKLKARWNKKAEDEVIEETVYEPVYVEPVVYTEPVKVETVVVKENATLSIQSPGEILLNKEANFVVSAKANDDENAMVVGKATMTNPEALEKLEYLGADDVWYEMSLEDTFGGETGFALVDSDLSFRAIFNTVGEYEITIELINVKDNSVVASTITNITVEKTPASLELTKEENIYVNRETKFTLDLTANDDENTMVVGKATMTNPEALEKLEYLGADDVWYEMSLEDIFGGETGFALVNGTSDFKATFNTIGEYELTVELINVEDESIVTSITEQIIVEEKPAEITFELPEEFIVGQSAEFVVSTIANDYADLMVVGSGSLSNPEAIEKLEYYEVNDDTWYELPADTNFGGSEGFALADASSKFRVTFKTVGEYEATFQILNAETLELVAETTETITVREFENPTIEFTAEEEFVVGKSTEFEISTIANDLENLIVIGKGGLSNPEAIEKLEYYEVDDDTWYELPADSNFGGVGFPLLDATSKFRVTFKTAGTYIVEYSIENAETNEVVASNSTEITVSEENNA